MDPNIYLCNNIHAPTSSSYNTYVNESSEHRGYIPSAIPVRSTNYVPKFAKYPAQEKKSKQTYFYVNLRAEKIKGYRQLTNTQSYSK